MWLTIDTVEQSLRLGHSLPNLWLWQFRNLYLDFLSSVSCGRHYLFKFTHYILNHLIKYAFHNFCVQSLTFTDNQFMLCSDCKAVEHRHELVHVLVRQKLYVCPEIQQWLALLVLVDRCVHCLWLSHTHTHTHTCSSFGMSFVSVNVRAFPR
jgi:hypothetical protein